MNLHPSNKERYFKLFASCIPVKGAARSVICDLQRGDAKFIPNSMYEVLTEYKNKPVDDIIADYGEDSLETLQEYFDFLSEHEFGFWCDNPESFPDLDLTFHKANLITNAIIDVNATSTHNFEEIFKQLDDLGCSAVQIRIFSPYSLEKLNNDLATTTASRLESLEIIIPYDEEKSEEALKAFCGKNDRIFVLSVHSAPFEKKISGENDPVTIFYVEDQITSDHHCGIVNQQYFNSNMELFLEGQKFNTCLNRKISIDVKGDIKNCPSLPQTYGNIQTDSLHSALIQKNFKDLWTINKDQVEICKDCEFRYICTDCRAFIQDPNNIYSKPSKCSYNPYEATWEGEEASEE